MTNMHSQYNFALTQIAQGRTILIYKGWPAKSAWHITKADRLSMRGEVMRVDGVGCKGMTVCVKP